MSFLRRDPHLALFFTGKRIDKEEEEHSVEESTSSMILANSEGQCNNESKNGSWEGHCQIMTIHLNDFDLILGIEFLVMTKVALIQHLHELMIMNNWHAILYSVCTNTWTTKKRMEYCLLCN